MLLLQIVPITALESLWSEIAARKPVSTVQRRIAPKDEVCDNPMCLIKFVHGVTRLVHITTAECKHRAKQCWQLGRSLQNFPRRIR